jgi:arylsulfatase A-like enzyme
MVYDGRFKYIHADGFAPMLYDLATDPQELHDLGTDPAHAGIRAHLYEALAKWSRSTRSQTTVSDAEITRNDARAQAYDLNIEAGVLIGYWDEDDLAAEQAKRAAFVAAGG